MIDDRQAPTVALWRLNLIRFLFLLMAIVMGTLVWKQLLFESAEWPVMRGLAKAMLASLALLSLIGVFRPLQMMPLMLYEILWKTVWLTLIAGRAYASGHWTADIESLFYDCIGIVVMFVIMPWRYVWARYFAAPAEPWRKTA